MEESLRRSAEHGDVEALYSILSEDPYVLDRIDMISFVDNPLHIAAAAGKTHFAMEIATLKPSIARKLNHLGLSPIHLALQNKQKQLVRSMLTIDSDFLRIKAKGRVTPLHYVTQMEDVDLMADILSVCPSAIEDLTAKMETAVHIAVKNSHLSVFKVLLGWLKRVNMEKILKWRDENGDTALHIATTTNQPEVMKLLIPFVNVNAKNLSGLTAKDMFILHRNSLVTEVEAILDGAKAKTASELSGSSITLAEYLSGDLSIVEKLDKFFGVFGQSQDKSASDHRNVELVVAALIATATYQATLSPPGGFWQDDSSSPSPANNPTNTTGEEAKHNYHRAGKLILGSDSQTSLFFFFMINSFAFYASMLTILKAISGIPHFRIIYCATVSFIPAYYASLVGTFPSHGAFSGWYGRALSVLTAIIYVSALLMMACGVLLRASFRRKKFKGPVDNGLL